MLSMALPHTRRWRYGRAWSPPRLDPAPRWSLQEVPSRTAVLRARSGNVLLVLVTLGRDRMSLSYQVDRRAVI